MKFLKIAGLLVSVVEMLILPSVVAAALQCYDCHGTRTAAASGDIRPEDDTYRNVSSGGFIGNHRSHTPFGATADSCAKCHPGSREYDASHRDGMIKVSPAINSSRKITAYNNRTSAWPQTPLPPQGVDVNTCSSVNCHFEKATLPWGSSVTLMSCASCHTSPPSSGSHGKKHGEYYGEGSDSCAKCHPDHAVAGNKFAHATSAGKRGIIVQFTGAPQPFGRYSGGSSRYPDYLEAGSPRNGSCLDIYCHSDGRGGAGEKQLTWSGGKTTECFSCHRGRAMDSQDADNCDGFGNWSAARNYCSPDLSMASNGHHRLVGPQGIRKYPCYYCHNATVEATPEGGIKDLDIHVNGEVEVEIHPEWNIKNRAPASYNKSEKRCDNVYCHSDGTVDPEEVKPYKWTDPHAACNACHGHPNGDCVDCHDGITIDPATGKLRELKTGWLPKNQWMGSMPMFPNQGPGTDRANSHTRHVQTNFTCDICHAETIRGDNCASISCHDSGASSTMQEVDHLNGLYHVDKGKTVVFKIPDASYKGDKSCSGTGVACHGLSGTDPVWGGSVNSDITCLGCHRTSQEDQDDFGAFNGLRGKINQQEWESSGHGRYSTSGRYPVSGNPAANFIGKPCWYCHDNNVLHNYSGNPYRLQLHRQYERRFEKECVYCHMERTAAECIACHVGEDKSIAPQATADGISYKYKFNNLSTIIRYPTHDHLDGCLNTSECHDSDSGVFPSGAHKGHDVNAGVWLEEQKADIKNQYMMMGVCLQCHDDDSGGQCTECHTAPANDPLRYSIGFKPFSTARFIKPKKARASSAHFGYKHYRAFTASGGWTKDGSGRVSGVWKGGKFCWDCHDPHGDSNIYMVQKKVATTTEGRFGIPLTRADVTFVDRASGTNYVRKTAPFDGICNVCHSPDSKHYTSSSGDGHNYTRVCTTCHEHRFADSHADKQACNSCHSSNKPIPKHTGFGLPRDCTKCHAGTVGKRMDVMGQMKSNSHHVQGVEVNNRHCYACHWESTPEGLIDLQHHTGYDYKNYTSVKNDYVDLVLWGPGQRPAEFREYSTAAGRASVTRFMAVNMGTGSERAEVAKITNHCLACHSDQNNDSQPFGDYRTPRQYAWDYQSVGSRYAQSDRVTWGKYSTGSTNKKKKLVKSFSAHGNAVGNQGGWSAASGYDGSIPVTRGAAGTKNIECFDCHNSHGSKVVGTTTSYTTFNGTNNGGNLKETKQNIGGYAYDYKASANTAGINPYGAGAGQCFDCHNSAANGTATPNGKTPWGYNTTFGATAPVMGYKDTDRFGQGTKGSTARFTERDIMKTIVGGHLSASFKLNSTLPHLAKSAGTASAGSATSLTDSSKTWPADKWKNMYLLVTSGVNSGQMRKIAANSSTTITLADADALTAAVAAGDSYQIVPYTSQVNGLCTPCHDPHGVSRTLGDKQQYAVPLLKGSWLTSPYQEDAPPPVPSGDRVSSVYTGSGNYNGKPRSWGKYVTSSWDYNHPSPTEPVYKVYLDRNTFGGSRINETADKFAGLCTNCHTKDTLTDGVKRNDGPAGFKTVDRIHESVKDWGVNSEHSFSCSKCHQPHNSGLPKLMVTNCLDYKHRSGIVSGGQPWAADKQYGNAHVYGREHRGYPIGSMNYARTSSNNFEATTACHVSRYSPTYNQNVPPPQWPDGNLWNNVTPW